LPNQNFRVKNGLEVGIGGTVLSAFESGKVGIGTTNSRYTLEVGAVGAAGTSLLVNGGARITGILSVGQGTIVIDGNTNTITADTIVATNFQQSGGSGYATQGYVGTQITNLVDNAPSDLNTLSKIASAINNDASYSTTINNALSLKANTTDLSSLNASNLTSGTIPNGRFPATLPTASGENLTGLNASNLNTGTVPTARIVGSVGDFTVGSNLYVNGTLSVGGTSVILNAAQLQVNDKDIVVGYTTNTNNNDVSNDVTANHGGISVASTVGSPLVNIPLQVGINSNPSTYKQLMWIRQGNYSGWGTDSWLSNYPISIGTTVIQNNSRLTVGAGFTVYDTYVDTTDIRSRNINVVGIVTATSFVKSGGTSSQFLKADGSVDSSTYLTTESDTLSTVTSRGNTTTNSISIGNITVSDINSSGISTVNIKQVAEVSTNNFNTTLAPSSGTLTIDSSQATVFLGSLNASVTTWAFTNVPTTNNRVTTVTLVIAGNSSFTYGDACSVNGTSITNGVKWSGGSSPTSTNNSDIVSFMIVRDGAGTINVFGSGNTNFS